MSDINPALLAELSEAEAAHLTSPATAAWADQVKAQRDHLLEHAIICAEAKRGDDHEHTVAESRTLAALVQKLDLVTAYAIICDLAMHIAEDYLDGRRS